MNPEAYRRLQEVFDRAVGLEGEARESFLGEACADDAELRSNVERLLARDRHGRGAFEAESPDAAQLAAGNLPLQIGRYRITKRLAEGGMGSVFLAEQDQPRRRVALKLIRPGVFSAEILRRFAFEAELLGRLQHPGIAQIYEAGEADTGAGRQPYFAMEYVDGLELSRYAAEHSLETAARLELLARVCDAVHHAHQKGIVHRDLKPGNILVAPATATSATSTRFVTLGQPKVLDFGVSRLAHDRPDATQLTQAGCVLGTPAYMSPEQARGDVAVDTRSDVYALGVIGFELITGRLPHDLTDLDLMQSLRRVQEQPAPSLDRVDPRFRGDLSVIVGKALEPDLDRRYASAAALSDDLRRLLADQPINARPPTLRYLLTRFVRRNAAFVALAMAAVLSLVVGLLLTLRAQRDEAEQRAVAEQRTAEAEHSAYAAQMQATMAHARSGDRQAARRLLTRTQPELRGWEWDYLSNLLEDDLHHFPMTVREPCAQVAPDTRYAVLVVDDTTLRLFDLESRTWTDRPCPEGGGLGAFLHERQAILWGRPDGEVQLLPLDEEQPPQSLGEAGILPEAMCVSTTGRRVALSGWNIDEPTTWGVVVLDLSRPGVLGRIRTVEKITALAIQPDGSRVAIGFGKEGTVEVLDAAGLGEGVVLHGHRGHVGAVRFSPSGRYLASGSHDRTIRIWSMPEGRLERVLGPVPDHADVLAFPDDGTLVSGHEGARIRRWNLETGACENVTSGPTTADPAHNRVLCLDLVGSEFVGAVCADGVRIRPLRQLFPDVLHHDPGDIYDYAYGVALSPSGRVLASAGWDGMVRFWDVTTGRPITTLPCPHQTFWAEYSRDGEQLLTSAQLGYGKHYFRLYDAVTLRLQGELLGATTHPCGAFVPRARAIVLGVGPELWVVDPATFMVREKRPYPAGVQALALSPDGSWLACSGWDGQLAILDATTLEPRQRIHAHQGGFGAIAWSPDGRRLATGGLDDEIRVWGFPTGEAELRIESPGSREFFALCFTPDGTRLLSGSRRKSIGVWDADSGLELLRLDGHWAYVHALALSRDGRILASASGDNTVRLWDTRPLADRLAEKERLLTAEREIRDLVARRLRELGSLEKVLAAIVADPELDALQQQAAAIVAHRLGKELR